MEREQSTQIFNYTKPQSIIYFYLVIFLECIIYLKLLMQKHKTQKTRNTQFLITIIYTNVNKIVLNF